MQKGYKINLAKTTAICMHSLSSVFPYYVALSSGISPNDLGLAKIVSDKKTKEHNKELAYIQCLDPCQQDTKGLVILVSTLLHLDPYLTSLDDKLHVLCWIKCLTFCAMPGGPFRSITSGVYIQAIDPVAHLL